MSVKKTGVLLCTLQQRSFRIFEEETENPEKYLKKTPVVWCGARVRWIDFRTQNN
jgi:hypothetical protein